MITLQAAELFRFEHRARIPFRYGIATMTECPHAIIRLTFDLEGATGTGLAADHLPPKWFTKDPKRALEDEVDEMVHMLRAAVTHARAIRAATPFAFWQELYAAQAAWAAQAKLPPLLAHFGTSFVERALIHAVCRSRRATLAAGLRGNAFEFDLGAVHAPLAGTAPRDWLPATPPHAVFARHTIGLSDPITAGDVAAGERVDDGLPQTLDECIRFYGLRHFKIKINGEAARDRARLEQMAAVLGAECGDDHAFSLDGNESFHDVASFAGYYRELVGTPALNSLWRHLLYVEQPWHRNVALSPAIGELARAWPDRPPIIIDESDGEIGSLPAALALGYAGTSHKNCKGIFKGAANACLLAQRRATGQPAVLSGEDLANAGPIGLIQDLAAQAAFGVTSIERNGHHYFAGLSQFPAALQRHALAQHPDLFVRGTQGWPRLEIRGGQIAIGTVNAAPFGVPGEVDLSELTAESLA
ncbi:MAG: hypothetical protein ACREH8_12265 [Opitutaceae bacterium]